MRKRKRKKMELLIASTTTLSSGRTQDTKLQEDQLRKLPLLLEVKTDKDQHKKVSHGPKVAAESKHVMSGSVIVEDRNNPLNVKPDEEIAGEVSRKNYSA